MLDAKVVTNSERAYLQSRVAPAFPGVRVSPSNSQFKEKTTMKRTLLAIAAAVILLNTLVVPNVARADNPGGTNCNGQMCKP
jgi:hypothetical protein